MNEIVTCHHQDFCSGCDFLGESIDHQALRKKDSLRTLLAPFLTPLPDIIFESPGTHALRDRLDFTLENGNFGLYRKDRKGVLAIEECRQLSPHLHDWFQDFRRSGWPPLRKGSIRLRVSPTGQRGAWLDFANEDVKALFEQKAWLSSLLDQSFVEIGQRRKKLVLTDQGLKLRDPEFHPWFESLWKEQKISLYTLVGSFTQPGLIPNRRITHLIRDWTTQSQARRGIEFGAGSGNLSFPALSTLEELVACESESLALEGFRQGLQFLASQGTDLRPRVRFEIGDFQRRSPPALQRAELLLANPPRSGLGEFITPLTSARDLETIIYMSCFPEAFALDAARLQGAGFRAQEIRILDQFPQTKHVEVLSYWRRA